jgi:microcystin-dependent protein
LGIGTNLPNATNAYLVQNGTALGSVSGSNTVTLTQANLPNYNLPAATTSSAGSHTHTVDPASANTNTTGSHTHTGTVGGHNWNGGGTYAGGFAAGPFAFYNPTLTINSDGNHAHSVDIPSTTSSSDGAHTHSVTVSSGGSGTAVNIAPRSLSVNTFIYLGN